MASAKAELYRLVEEENWVKVVQRASAAPEEATFVDAVTQMTALHLAVRCNHKDTSRIAAIRALLEAHPEAATQRDEEFGYTPLAYACLTQEDTSTAQEDDLQIVSLLVEYNPKSMTVLGKDGHSPLELHIMALSRLKRSPPALSRRSSKPHDSFLILKELLKQNAINNQGIIARALELLVECNTLEILEQVALEEAQASTSKLRARRQARSSGISVTSNPAYSVASSTLANFWVWECALLLLRSEHRRCFAKAKPEVPPFYALHMAAHVKDCPLPILLLALRADPTQVRIKEERTGNLPLHMVAGWDIAEQSCISRKSMALSALVSEHPGGTKVRNQRGKTPLSLALETGTTWDNGVRRLTTFSKESSFSSQQ